MLSSRENSEEPNVPAEIEDNTLRCLASMSIPDDRLIYSFRY